MRKKTITLKTIDNEEVHLTEGDNILVNNKVTGERELYRIEKVNGKLVRRRYPDMQTFIVMNPPGKTREIIEIDM